VCMYVCVCVLEGVCVCVEVCRKERVYVCVGVCWSECVYVCVCLAEGPPGSSADPLCVCLSRITPSYKLEFVYHYNDFACPMWSFPNNNNTENSTIVPIHFVFCFLSNTLYFHQNEFQANFGICFLIQAAKAFLISGILT